MQKFCREQMPDVPLKNALVLFLFCCCWLLFYYYYYFTSQLSVLLTCSKHRFKSMYEEGKLVNPLDSARILVSLLKSNSFEDGAHLDYFDLIQIN